METAGVQAAVGLRSRGGSPQIPRARAKGRLARLGAALAAVLALGAAAARAQGAADAPGPSDFAGQYAAAVSSSARLDAVMGAIRSNSPAQAAWLINDFNSESVPAIRAWMIRGVADVAPRQGLSLFEQGLKDQSPWVRLAAVDSLGRLGTPQAVSDLTGVLSQEMNPGVRQSAAYWLGKIGGTSAVAALGQSLTADANPNVRVQAAQALLAAGTPQARRALAAGENDADERVRQIAHGR